MAIYIESDIRSNYSGDICLSPKGDLDLGSSVDTYFTSVNFILKTNNGEYQPNSLVGADLGYFVGEINNTESHQQMKYNIDTSLDRIMDPKDISSYVTYFTREEALCTVFLKGTFLIDNELVDYERITLTYAFPYLEGEATIQYTDLR